MRRAYNENGFIEDSPGVVVGVALGFDFCAEHEWGVSRLKELFGVGLDPDAVGIDARRITRCPSLETGDWGFVLKTKGQRSLLYFGQAYTWEDENKEEKLSERADLILAGKYGELSLFQDDDFATSWCDGDFGIMVKGEDNRKVLVELHEHFMRKDIAIGMTGAKHWLGSGLTFVYASALPPDVCERVRQQDLSERRLKQAFKDTGIEDVLTAAGRKWFSLKPSWTGEDEKEIRVWLNPMDQKNNNYGWYSIDQLRDWAEGKGPIPMNKEKENV